MKADLKKFYSFAPLLADGSGERQVMRISEVDLMRLKFGRGSKPTTVYDVRTPKSYVVQGCGNDSKLVGPAEEHARASGGTTMRRTRRERDQKLNDDARMVRAWRRWHAEQLAEVLEGPHGAAVAQVIAFLKNMGPQSASSADRASGRTRLELHRSRRALCPSPRNQCRHYEAARAERAAAVRRRAPAREINRFPNHPGAARVTRNARRTSPRQN